MGLLAWLKTRQAENIKADCDAYRALLKLTRERWIVSACVGDGGSCVENEVGAFGVPYGGHGRPLPYVSAYIRAVERAEEFVTVGVWNGDELIPARYVRDVTIRKKVEGV